MSRQQKQQQHRGKHHGDFSRKTNRGPRPRKAGCIPLVNEKNLHRVLKRMQNEDPDEDIAFYGAVKVSELGRCQPGQPVPPGAIFKLLKEVDISQTVWSSALFKVHKDFLQLKTHLEGLPLWVICVGYNNFPARAPVPDIQLGITGKEESVDKGHLAACVERETLEETNLQVDADSFREVIRSDDRRCEYLEVHYVE